MTDLERVRLALAAIGYSENVKGDAIIVTVPGSIEGKGDLVEAIEAGKLRRGTTTRLRFNEAGELDRSAT